MNEYMGDKNDKLLLGRCCEAVEVWGGTERRKHIRFPVCLSVKYGNRIQKGNTDFVLNISKGGIFIRTETLIPVGSSLSVLLYIPPHGKHLGEFNGKVVRISEGCSPDCPRGIHIQFADCTPKAKKSLSDYLEEKHHLLDEVF